MSDVLSQKEIDALRNAVSEGTLDTLEESTPEQLAAETYDFANRNRQLVSRLPGLKAVYSGFAVFLNTAVAGAMRRMTKVEMTSLLQSTVDELFGRGESLSCICVVKVIGHKQPILLILDSTLLVSFIDAICGGEGRPITMEGKQEMGPIEQRIVRRFAEDVVNALEQALKVTGSIQVELESIEFQRLVLTALPGPEVLEVAVFQISMEGVQGELTLAVPHGLIESIRPQLMMLSHEGEASDDGQWANIFKRSLSQLEVDLAVEVARSTFSVREIFNFKCGDIIDFDPHPEDQLVVSVEGIPKLHGMAGTVRNAQAVRIINRLGE